MLKRVVGRLERAARVDRRVKTTRGAVAVALSVLVAVAILLFGGTNTAGEIELGYTNGGGTYNFNGGVLITTDVSESVGALSGPSAFNFGAGTLRASGTLTGGSMTLTGIGGNATVDTAGYAANLLGLSGSGGLTKIGSGTLLRSGNNTYASGGTLAVSTGGIGWISANIASLLAGNGSGFATGSALGIDTAAGNFSYGSNIAGNMTLTKLGGNSLILTGTNTYIGGTLIYAGTLQLGDGTTGHDGSVTGNIVNNAALAFDLSGNQSNSGTISGNGSLAKTGSGTLTLTANNIYSGPTMVKQGTLLVNGSLVSSVAVNSGGTLGGAGNLTSGTIDGYPATLAVQNENLVLNVVPEPGTLALLGVGAVGLGTANSFNPKPTTTAGEKPFQERACGIGILPVRGLETNSWRRSRLAKRRDQSHTRNPRKDNQHENVESSIPPRTCSAHWFLLCQRPGGR